MNTIEKDRLHKRLLTQREEIRLLTNFRGETRNGSEGVQDFYDLAANNIDSDIADGLDENESDLLDSIDLALERIAGGTYGICEDCEKKIPVERLRARPSAALCVPCQMAEEKQKAATRPRRRDESSF